MLEKKKPNSENKKERTSTGREIKKNSGRMLHLCISKEAGELLEKDRKGEEKVNLTQKIERCILASPFNNKSEVDKMQQLIEFNRDLYNQINASNNNLKQVKINLNRSDFFEAEYIQKNFKMAERLINSLEYTNEEFKKLRAFVVEMLIILSSTRSEKKRWSRARAENENEKLKKDKKHKTADGRRLCVYISKEANEILKESIRNSTKKYKITEKIEQFIIEYYSIERKNEIDKVHQLVLLNKELILRSAELTNQLNNVTHSLNIFQMFDPQSIKNNTERLEKLISILEAINQDYKKLRTLFLEMLITLSSRKEKSKWLEIKEAFINKINLETGGKK